MRITDYECGLEHLARFIEHEENGIAREVVIFHIASRMALHAEPVFFAIKVTRITSDDQVFLRELHILKGLRKAVLLVENEGAR